MSGGERDRVAATIVLIKLSGNAFVSGAGGLRFKSRAGQIEHSVAKDSPPLRHFFQKAVFSGVMTRR